MAAVDPAIELKGKVQATVSSLLSKAPDFADKMLKEIEKTSDEVNKLAKEANKLMPELLRPSRKSKPFPNPPLT